uniref:C-type lectin domain-containing protein n=1 Tax=Neogobius melanostomus TaxID=47308 RepID=A0A8C6TWX1_9GOBI
MTPNLILLLLELVVTVTAGKYVYVRFQLNWFEAQTYCRTNYTDLAPIHSEYDTRLIQKLNLNVGKMTWDEALQYCRTPNKDLASVASAGEMLLMDKELSKGDTTQHVWIGLTFLDGNWVWTDGQMFDYELWGPGEQVTFRQWSAIDCDKKLHFLCYD